MSSVQAVRQAARGAFRLHDHQLIPEVDWTTRIVLGGRGSGKTFAGAYWINVLADIGAPAIALVGPTLHDVREVMIEGRSGIRALARDMGCDVPRWEAGRKRLSWPRGAYCQAFSAEDPDSLRGPQFHAAWADEFCTWRRPETVISTLRMALRLGEKPQLMVTTTPRPLPALRRLMRQDGTNTEVGATSTNVANLSPGFLDHLTTLYGGTRLAAQELDGLIVDADGALFRAEDLLRARGEPPPQLDRVVVAVDPPASAGGDACGIVAAGRAEGRIFVLADRTVRGRSPVGWARRVTDAAEEFGAALVVAEANQGGDMVRAVLEQGGCRVPVRLVHARHGKRIRAEPVAALYEQGRIVHCAAFPALEEELMALGAEGGGASPDRADALVWAVTELGVGREGPRIRML